MSRRNVLLFKFREFVKLINCVLHESGEYRESDSVSFASCIINSGTLSFGETDSPLQNKIAKIVRISIIYFGQVFISLSQRYEKKLVSSSSSKKILTCPEISLRKK